MISISSVFLEAAERVDAGIETFSCNALRRGRLGRAGQSALQIYRDTIGDLAYGDVMIQQFTRHDNGTYRSAEESRDLRVLTLCMMAAMTAPKKRRRK